MYLRFGVPGVVVAGVGVPGRLGWRRELHSRVCDVLCLPKTERTRVADVVFQVSARVLDSSLGLYTMYQDLVCLLVLLLGVQLLQKILEPPRDKIIIMAVRPAKTQISLGIHPVWSVFTVRMKKAWILSYPLSECTAMTLIKLGGCPG